MSLGEPAVRRPPAGVGTIVVLSLAMLGAVVVRLAPPSPRAADAPPQEFSAGRAAAVLRRLVGDAQPHPVGSAANARVRDAVLAELHRLGFEPRVESGFACSPYGVCATVENVVARLAGRGGGKAVLLAAHYDSVGAGPGASDDGVGVAAVLETARALRAGPPLERPVLLLIDDGEEAGLLGAEAFVRSPAFAEVGAVVNLEARGTSGASLMFETRQDNAWVVRRLAAALPRPLANSVFYTIYQRMPNDTDFTVFKAAGVQGANFAFVGDVLHYHTPLDDLAHADLGSLQHHGEHALATVRAFATADLEAPAKGDAVFFDLLATGIVAWPERLGLPLAAATLLLALVSCRGLARRNGLRLAGLVRGFLAALLVPVAAVAGGIVLLWILRRFGAFPAAWVAHQTIARLAFWALAFTVFASCGALLRRAKPGEAWAGGTLLFVGLGALLAALLPGLSYLFLAPALVAGGLALAWAFGPGRGWLAIVLPSGLAMALFFPFAWQLDDGLGVGVLPGTAALVGLALVPALGALTAPPRWLMPSAVAAVLALGVAAVGLPTASPEQPAHINLQYLWDADAASARWTAASEGPLPAALAATGFAAQRSLLFAWSGPVFVAAAPAQPLPPPELALTSSEERGDGRRVRFLLRSPRGAPLARLALPPESGVLGAIVGGQRVPTERRRRAGGHDWTLLQCATLPAAGIEIELQLATRQPLAVNVQDVSPGLPEAAAPLRAARGPAAVPVGSGDSTVVTRQVRF